MAFTISDERTIVRASKAAMIAIGIVDRNQPMISVVGDEAGSPNKMDAFLFGGVYGEAAQLQSIGASLLSLSVLKSLQNNGTYFDSIIGVAIETLKFKMEQIISETLVGGYAALNFDIFGSSRLTALIRQTLIPSFPSARATTSHSDSTRGQFFQFYFRSLKPSIWKSDIGNKLAPKGVVRFKPIITSLSDSYSPKWSQQNILGSVQQIHRYERTDRSIDMAFSLFADSFLELQFNIWRLNWLADHCYGSLRNFDEFQKERQVGGDKSKFVQNIEYKEFPFMRATVGTVFIELPCYISSLKHNFMMDDGWELGDEMENAIMKRKNIQFPFKIDISLNLTVLYDKEDPTSYNYYRQYFELELGKYMRWSENGWSTNPDDDASGLLNAIRSLF